MTQKKVVDERIVHEVGQVYRIAYYLFNAVVGLDLMIVVRRSYPVRHGRIPVHRLRVYRVCGRQFGCAGTAVAQGTHG